MTRSSILTEAPRDHTAAASLALKSVLRVERTELIADDGGALTLVDPGGRELPRWSPGAHVDRAAPP